MGERVLVNGGSVPRFAPHVRFRFDRTRERWVVLAPERLLLPDDIAVEVLKRCDGTRTVEAITDELSSRFAASAEAVGRDVALMLQDLVDKGFMET